MFKIAVILSIIFLLSNECAGKMMHKMLETDKLAEKRSEPVFLNSFFKGGMAFKSDDSVKLEEFEDMEVDTSLLTTNNDDDIDTVDKDDEDSNSFSPKSNEDDEENDDKKVDKTTENFQYLSSSELTDDFGDLTFGESLEKGKTSF